MKNAYMILASVGRLYGRLKLRWKILFSYMLLLVLLVISLGIAALWQTSRLVDDRFLTAVSSALNQLGIHLSYRMQIVVNSSEIVAWNNDLLRILKYESGTYPLARQIDDIQIVKDILMTVRSNRDVLSVRLYMPEDSLLSRERSTFFPLSEIEGMSWFPSVTGSGGRVLWLGAREERQARESPITCVRCIRDPTNVSGCLAVLVIDVDPKVVTNVMRRSGLLHEASGLVLLDSAGEAVATVGEPPDDIISEIKEYDYAAGITDHKPYRILRARLDFPDWQLYAFIPDEAVKKGKVRLILTFLGILGVVSTLATIFTLRLSRRISERITKLAKVVSDPPQPQSAGLNKPERYDDEITQLEQFLLQLVAKNRELVGRVFEEQMAEKEAKLQALQMQINPHFLYNTLDTINWMALEKRELEISDLVSLLARYYRLSINRGVDVVTIAEEIEHVKVFLRICEKRYEGSVRAIFDVADEILRYKTVKLVLQPLAENAVVHGIANTESQSGAVTIAGVLRESHIEISVADDGIGMKKEDYERIIANERAGFAVKNVDERVRMFCGPRYGLSYDFGVPVGTRAILRLAKIR